MTLASATERIAASAWPLRAAEELRSAFVFRAIAHAARIAGAPSAAWAPSLWRVVGDELRHARLCTELGARLGAAPPRHDLSPVRARLLALPDPRRRLTHLLLVEAALGETVSVALFRAGRRAAVEPATRAALSSILADEVRHAQLGWALLSAAWPTLATVEQSLLAHEAARGLGALEQQVAVPALRRLDAGERFDPTLARLGVLDPEARVDAFYAAIERQVLPRLATLGLDGAALWRERYQVRRRD
jgi:hypothetical protein